MIDLNSLAGQIHQNAVRHGFYPRGAERNIGELLALVHSEVSEALEDWRNERMETYEVDGGKPCGFPSEIADIIIRCLDVCSYLQIDIEKEIEDKMEFNKGRERRHGGRIA